MKKTIITLAVFLLTATAYAGHGGDMDHSNHKQMIEKAVKVKIGKKGFKPQTPLHFKPNENIVLNITRTTKKTCMTELKHPKTGKMVNLPLNKEVRFDIGSYEKPTEVKLLCGMKMKAGVIHVGKRS